MNDGQFAVIKKDIQSITSNKQIFAVLLIVPLVLTLVLPSIFVFVISFAPDAASDFQKLLDILPAASGKSDQQRIFGLILNNIMPVFFLIIPIMASSVMAAISLAAIAVTVRGSAKAQTIEEAQQRAVFLVFPILALVVGQFTGIIMINAGLLWGVGSVLAALDLLFMRGVAGRFAYEKLLR